jgi:polysaccharide biosynthesis protein PslH
MPKVPHRILVVVPCVPYPPDDGHKIRIWNQLRHLSPEWEFDFVAFGGSTHLENREHWMAKLGPACKDLTIVDSESLKLVKLTNWRQSIKNVYYPLEFSAGIPFYSEAMKEHIKNKTESRQYDLIFYSGFYIYLHGQPGKNQPPFVVDIIDSYSLLMKSLLKTEKNLFRKPKRVLEYIWARRYEKLHFSKAKNMILISPVDRDYVRQSCREANIWVAPNGVDVEYYRPDESSAPVANSLLFTGVLDYQPNHESIIHFIENILPIIQREVHGVTLTIVGKNPPNKLQSLAKEMNGITLTGYVDDIRPFFDKAMVYVAPMISGAGLKNKVLEAWSMSKPVVSTSMACYGLSVTHGENILIADKPKDFARQVISLFQDDKLRIHLSLNARKTVTDLYSWNRQAAILEKIFEQIINRTKPS